MNYRDWARDNRRLLAALANSFPVTPSAVHQWRRNGVPIDRMEGVRKFTGRQVSIAEMATEAAALRAARREVEEV